MPRKGVTFENHKKSKKLKLPYGEISKNSDAKEELNGRQVNVGQVLKRSTRSKRGSAAQSKANKKTERSVKPVKQVNQPSVGDALQSPSTGVTVESEPEASTSAEVVDQQIGDSTVAVSEPQCNSLALLPSSSSVPIGLDTNLVKYLMSQFEDQVIQKVDQKVKEIEAKFSPTMNDRLRPVEVDEKEPLFEGSKFEVSSYRKKIALQKNATMTSAVSQILTAVCSVEDVFGVNLRGRKSTINRDARRKLPLSNDIHQAIFKFVEVNFAKGTEEEKNWKSTVNRKINEKLGQVNRHFEALRRGEQNHDLPELEKTDFPMYERYSDDPALFNELEDRNAERHVVEPDADANPGDELYLIDLPPNRRLNPNGDPNPGDDLSPKDGLHGRLNVPKLPENSKPHKSKQSGVDIEKAMRFQKLIQIFPSDSEKPKKKPCYQDESSDEENNFSFKRSISSESSDESSDIEEEERLLLAKLAKLKNKKKKRF